ncbi:MAG: hypothetical protein J6Z11_05420, partial [Candidatus Riflebacteria bacterium]|nr:hypothetical protein [Candidatus Riflebacteria bacterium]
LNNNRQEEETILVPKGDPEKPLTYKDIVNKLRVCGSNLVNENQLNTLIQYINNFGKEELLDSNILFIV